MKFFKPFTFLTILLSFSLIICSATDKEEALRKKAAEIHQKVLTIDTHCDTPMWLMNPKYNIGVPHDAKKDRNRVDLPRMKQGGLDASFFAVFLGQGKRDTENYKKATTRAVRIFDAIHNMVKVHASLATLALTPADAYKIEKTGKRAIYIGIENGYPIAEDLNLIEKFYKMGARYITLCHTKNNQICDSSTDKPEHNGLSPFGIKVVKEMNRLGMLIDVSHISDASFYDVIKHSKAPVFASHSCARAICDNPRNMDDKMLKALAKNDGVIQMCILSGYVKKSPPNKERDAAFKKLRTKYSNFDALSPADKQKARKEYYALYERFPRVLATVKDVVDHIDHIVKVAGINHVGIGTDFDGGGGVKDCYDVSQMGNITLELVRRGYSEEEIRKIWGGNFIRVFKKTIAIAKKQ